jgi:hypothetical protein
LLRPRTIILHDDLLSPTPFIDENIPGVSHVREEQDADG